MGTRFEGNDIEAARMRSLSGQDDFDERDDIPWRDDYSSMLQEEWSWYEGPAWNRWRLAAYVAWASYRGTERWPKTLGELAQMLGWSSERPLRKYRHRYPQLERMVSEAIMEPLLARRAQVLETLGVLAETTDYKTHNDRKLFFEMTGMHEQRQAIDLRTVTSDVMAEAQKQARDELGDFEDGFFDDAVTPLTPPSRGEEAHAPGEGSDVQEDMDVD